MSDETLKDITCFLYNNSIYLYMWLTDILLVLITSVFLLNLDYNNHDSVNLWFHGEGRSIENIGLAWWLDRLAEEMEKIELALG